MKEKRRKTEDLKKNEGTGKGQKKGSITRRQTADACGGVGVAFDREAIFLLVL